MAVKINYESYLSFFTYLLDEIFDRGYFRATCIPIIDIPIPIQILTREVSPIMPENNAIRVHHRYHVHHIIFNQKLLYYFVKYMDLFCFSPN